ncbi:hypothetical protein IFT59_10630 [Rhizobium sp. CFBP 8752]|nr:hypothetical protein [Rhizobium sp. CFBP 13726]MBD8663702.1 hypothetical protein [Rhizobium sp. CFBP 8752]NSY16730.1 hypothetical protein [Neorhizobium sp. AL 9.2.2]
MAPCSYKTAARFCGTCFSVFTERRQWATASPNSGTLTERPPVAPQ